MTDQFYMKRAIELSKIPWGLVSPNPYVGAVIVKDDQIIAEGWHKKAGTDHAEVDAIKKAGSHAKDSTIYVTLEPCSHQGRTGPCTEAIIKSGIKRVVYAIDDANPLVAGRSEKILTSAGIKVTKNILASEAKKINEVFFYYQKNHKPFVVLKAGMSLDGKLATASKDSKWITSSLARERTHELRAGYDAILIGTGTLNSDNPQLTIREGRYQEKQPIRIILSGKTVAFKADVQIFNTQVAPTWLIYPEETPPPCYEELERKGIRLIPLQASANGKIDLELLLIYLGKEGIQSLFLEGGPQIHTSFLEKNLVNKLYLFLAPMLIGGKEAPGIWNGAGNDPLKSSTKLTDWTWEAIGPDMLVTAYPIKGGAECSPD